MWPKMLLDVLPHLSRLLPMWDKFLSSKAANDKQMQVALDGLAEEVRSATGQIASANNALIRQVQDQTARIDVLTLDLQLAREAAEKAESQVRDLHKQTQVLAARTQRLLFALVGIAIFLVTSILLQIFLRGAR